VYDFGVVDLVEVVLIVVVVDEIDSVHQLIEVAVQQVDLEGSQDVEIGPGVQVEGDLQLLPIYHALLIEKIHQPMEYLQLLHLQTKSTVDHCSLPDLTVSTLNLTHVFLHNFGSQSF
jgi:hypothetical protein